MRQQEEEGVSLGLQVSVSFAAGEALSIKFKERFMPLEGNYQRNPMKV